MPYRCIHGLGQSPAAWSETLWRMPGLYAADAHCPENVAKGIPEALDILREIGYTEYTVFVGRRPQQIPIEYIPAERV